MEKYNSEKREDTIAEMQTLLEQLERYAVYLIEVNKTIKKIDKDVETMEEYYLNDWLDDYNHFKSKKNYTVLMQDPIHNALQEIHQEKLKMAKKIISKLE